MLRVLGPFLIVLVIGVGLGWFLNDLADGPALPGVNPWLLEDYEQELNEWRTGQRRLR